MVKFADNFFMPTRELTSSVTDCRKVGFFGENGNRHYVDAANERDHAILISAGQMVYADQCDYGHFLVWCWCVHVGRTIYGIPATGAWPEDVNDNTPPEQCADEIREIERSAHA